MAAQQALKTKSCVRPTRRAAELALAAFRGVDWPVALIDSDGVALLQNRCFEESFACERGTASLDRIVDAFRNGDEKIQSHRLPVSDGRTFLLDLVDLPEGILVTGRDITERLTRDAEAHRAARLDSLTGLGNRLSLVERLEEIADGGDERGAALLAISLQRFKRVNETLGRQIGNDLLKVVAERLLSALDPSDVAVRTGADEFAVLTTRGSLPQTADGLAARLVDLLGRTYVVEGQLINVGVSIGIALMPTDAPDAEGLIRDAGLAVSRAMREPKPSYRFFEDEMNREMQTRHSLEIDLRRALALRELELVYQPQCNLGARRIASFEALLRWRNAERGFVSPGEFIPLAEEIGLIVPVGEWVLRTACREAAAWRTPYRIAVNVSAIQIAAPGFPGTVLTALSETGLAPERLELEITESVLLGDSSAALATLHRLKKLGVRISMDDFGTGYSSLSCLRSFPFDTIKIDQSFVRGRPDDDSGMAIVRAAAALGTSLGMTTVAEGVETEEQLELVAEAGCTDAQGFLISRPLPPAEIETFLAAYTTRARSTAAAEAARKE